MSTSLSDPCPAATWPARAWPGVLRLAWPSATDGRWPWDGESLARLQPLLGPVPSAAGRPPVPKP